MIIAVQIILLFTLILIFLQDIKDRLVYWILFPVAGILFGIAQFVEVGKINFFQNVLMNFSIVTLILLILLGYIKIRFREAKFFDVFGPGDVLFLLSVCFSFPTISFVSFLISGLLFSLSVHFVLPVITKQKNATVPLAGYLAIFYALILVGHWFGFNDYLYLS